MRKKEMGEYNCAVCKGLDYYNSVHIFQGRLNREEAIRKEKEGKMGVYVSRLLLTLSAHLMYFLITCATSFCRASMSMLSTKSLLRWCTNMTESLSLAVARAATLLTAPPPRLFLIMAKNPLIMNIIRL